MAHFFGQIHYFLIFPKYLGAKKSPLPHLPEKDLTLRELDEVYPQKRGLFFRFVQGLYS